MPVCEFCNGTGTRNYFDTERNEEVIEPCSTYKLRDLADQEFWTEELNDLLRFLFKSKRLVTIQEDMKLVTLGDGFVYTFMVSDTNGEVISVKICSRNFLDLGKEVTTRLKTLLVCYDVEGEKYTLENLESILNGTFNPMPDLKVRITNKCKL